LVDLRDHLVGLTKRPDLGCKGFKWQSRPEGQMPETIDERIHAVDFPEQRHDGGAAESGRQPM